MSDDEIEAVNEDWECTACHWRRNSPSSKACEMCRVPNANAVVADKIRSTSTTSASLATATIPAKSTNKKHDDVEDDEGDGERTLEMWEREELYQRKLEEAKEADRKMREKMQEEAKELEKAKEARRLKKEQEAKKLEREKELNGNWEPKDSWGLTASEKQSALKEMNKSQELQLAAARKAREERHLREQQEEEARREEKRLQREKERKLRELEGSYSTFPSELIERARKEVKDEEAKKAKEKEEAAKIAAEKAAAEKKKQAEEQAQKQAQKQKGKASNVDDAGDNVEWVCASCKWRRNAQSSPSCEMCRQPRSHSSNTTTSRVH